MNAVQVGQVWRNKDKRRNTTIEILAVGDETATGLKIGTELEVTNKISTLTTHWELIKDAPVVTEAPVEAPAPSRFKTREQYLEAAVKELTRKIFAPLDIDVPVVKVSVGWPGGRGPKSGVLGQCFTKNTNAGNVAQIFVTPAVDDAYTTVETLAHELIHAIAEGNEEPDKHGAVKHHGHRGEFVRIAKAIGFLAPWKSTPASEELQHKLEAISAKLGTYPHSAINLNRPATQKTYYLLLESTECSDCPDGYKLRMTEKWLEEVGAPLCPHGIEMEVR